VGAIHTYAYRLQLQIISIQFTHRILSEQSYSIVNMYTESQKNVPSSNINRFSTSFNCHTLRTIFNEVIIKYPSTL